MWQLQDGRRILGKSLRNLQIRNLSWPICPYVQVSHGLPLPVRVSRCAPAWQRWVSPPEVRGHCRGLHGRWVQATAICYLTDNLNCFSAQWLVWWRDWVAWFCMLQVRHFQSKKIYSTFNSRAKNWICEDSEKMVKFLRRKHPNANIWILLNKSSQIINSGILS